MAATILLDLGNSSVKMAALDAKPVLLGSVPTREWIGKPSVLPADLYVACSVVPDALKALRTVVPSGKRLLVVGEDITIPLKNATRSPATTGTDRLVCAYETMRSIGPDCLVVSCGTALVFSVVREGRFVGGNIIPGPQLQLDSLRKGTAQLDFSHEGVDAESALGDDTPTAMVRGVLWGLAGAIDRLGDEYGDASRAQGIITGGWAVRVVPLIRSKLVYHPNVLFEGLARLARVNGIA
ncbi:MAG: type III pantothenate kinase [Candidatus Brocadiia bacterium]